MRARALKKRIGIYQITDADDGYGGKTVTNALLLTTWASIKTLKGLQAYVDLGLDYTKLNVQVTVRKQNYLDYNSTTLFFKYRGDNYTIKTFPVNTDFNDAFVTFIGVKEKPGTYEVFS